MLCILGLGHVSFQVLLNFLASTMPHKSDKPGRKPVREDPIREEDSELDLEAAGRDAITSPISLASSYSSSSGSASSAGSGSSGATLSSEQLEMILTANSRVLAESMAVNSRSMEASIAANNKSMEASLMSILSTLSPDTPAASSSSRSSPKAQVKVPKWSDEEVPYEFFTKLEKALAHNGIDKSSWGQLLPVYLTGKAQAALAQVPVASLSDYEAVKSVLLESLGDTPTSADRKWWALSRQPSEDACAFYLRVRAVGIRRLEGLSSKEEILERLVLSRFLSLLHSDSYAGAMARQPKNGLEAAKIVQELEETRAYTRRKNPWRSDSQQHSGRREQNYSNGSSNSRSSSPPKSASGNSSNSQASNSENSSKGEAGNKGWKKARKPIICYGCREPGHLRPDCPNKVKRVVSPVQEAESDESLIAAVIGGVEVSNAEVDTGCDRTLVHPDFIPEGSLLNKTCVLKGYQGNSKTHELAKVTIGVGSVSDTVIVAVDDTLEYPALLGKDLSWVVKSEMLRLVKMEVDKKVEEEKQVSQSVCVTRAQARKAKQQEQEDEAATAASECQPTELSQIFDFHDSMFLAESEPTPVEKLACWPSESEVTLPSLSVGQGEKISLAQEQVKDVTLSKSLEAARKGEKDFSFVDEILVHASDDGFDVVKRIVVPSSRREQVLRAAHSDSTAGHFGYKRTLARIARYFMWPGMWKDVRQFVRNCGDCQRAAKNTNAKAPLQPLPVVSEPFAKVALDIVGPLPRTKKGNKYLLTMICLFTKFPVAIPVRRIDNETILNAMVEVFATYGIPHEILTDQGSVFCSRLTRAFCKLLNIDKVRTSPYHPQSNGSLERWHACLKSMLRKAGKNLKEWDCTLKYLLMAYRDSPHSVTGFSPFSLMFGREARGPLELLRSSWADSVDTDVSNVSEWLVAVKQRMCEMAVLVSDREKVAKQKMKAYYDKGAKIKSFAVGEEVLVRRPALHGKFEKSWDGPFEVGKVVSPVTYLIKRPGHSSRSKCIHANLLRKWVAPVDCVNRVAFVLEEDGECQTPPRLKLARENFEPTPRQEKLLQAVLEDFSDVLTSKPGKTDLAVFSINTGDHDPVSGPHWRIPPKWVEEVKKQVDDLLAMGIIVPSVSPWASSVVTVKKKDGGIRICVDYRALNNCTQPDPYMMPLIEQILETLATAKFISKIDLNKGFHQIPVNPDDQVKTAFITPWGKFHFVVMPFGVRNGPATFQRLMDGLLHQDLDISRVYIDDIAVFSSSWEAHCRDLARVFSRLRQAGLTANLSKCQFGQTTCEFLGHLVGNGKVSPAALKVKAVQDFIFPRSKRQVRQFLGLTGYYRKFIPKYSEHSFQLTEATRKLAPDRVKQTAALLEEFAYLKQQLCLMPLLTLPVPSDSFVLQTDASGVGLGAVLNVTRENELHPVAFHSRKLQPREQRYSASELECLAVVDAVNHFGCYLIPQQFLVETDHKALTYLMSAKHQNGRLARWALQLQPYTFSIRYRAGKENVNADVLSRMWEEEDVALPLLHPLNEGGGDVGISTPGARIPNIAEARAEARAVPLRI